MKLTDEGVCSDEKPYAYATQKNVPVIFITSDAEDGKCDGLQFVI